MNQDPAFLFYTADFFVGVALMKNEQVGAYVRLLCLQHQSGHLPIETIKQVCGGQADPAVLKKFSKDSDGLYFNKRLDAEMQRRAALSEKNRRNAEQRWQGDGNASAVPAETETENKGKAKTLKEREAEFTKKVLEIGRPNAAYSGMMLKDFLGYWTEKNEGGRKMRYEMQQTFDITRRLATWHSRSRSSKAAAQPRNDPKYFD